VIVFVLLMIHQWVSCSVPHLHVSGCTLDIALCHICMCLAARWILFYERLTCVVVVIVLVLLLIHQSVSCSVPHLHVIGYCFMRG
jgi:hypothetical protein